MSNNRAVLNNERNKAFFHSDGKSVEGHVHVSDNGKKGNAIRYFIHYENGESEQVYVARTKEKMQKKIKYTSTNKNASKIIQFDINKQKYKKIKNNKRGIPFFKLNGESLPADADVHDNGEEGKKIRYHIFGPGSKKEKVITYNALILRVEENSLKKDSFIQHSFNVGKKKRIQRNNNDSNSKDDINKNINLSASQEYSNQNLGSTSEYENISNISADQPIPVIDHSVSPNYNQFENTEDYFNYRDENRESYFDYSDLLPSTTQKWLDQQLTYADNYSSDLLFHPRQPTTNPEVLSFQDDEISNNAQNFNLALPVNNSAPYQQIIQNPLYNDPFSHSINNVYPDEVLYMRRGDHFIPLNNLMNVNNNQVERQDLNLPSNYQDASYDNFIYDSNLDRRTNDTRVQRTIIPTDDIFPINNYRKKRLNFYHTSNEIQTNKRNKISTSNDLSFSLQEIPQERSINDNIINNTQVASNNQRLYSSLPSNLSQVPASLFYSSASHPNMNNNQQENRVNKNDPRILNVYWQKK